MCFSSWEHPRWLFDTSMLSFLTIPVPYLKIISPTERKCARLRLPLRDKKSDQKNAPACLAPTNSTSRSRRGLGGASIPPPAGRIEPTVADRLRGGHPRRRIFLQKLPYKVFCLHRDAVPPGGGEIEVSVSDGGENLRIGLAVERRVTGKKDVRDHPDGPQVASLVVFASENLGRNVVRCSDKGGHRGLHVLKPGEPEVDDLFVECSIYY